MVHSWSSGPRGVREARSASIALGIVLALAAGGCSDSLGPGEVDAPTDRILFLSSQGSVVDHGSFFYNIYSMNTDGSDVQNLTQYPTSYGDLHVTPDGRSVIFSASLPSNDLGGGCRHHIWSMKFDGSQRKAVTSGACQSKPRVSPGGTRIAYLQDRSIYVANIDGSSPRNVSYALPPVSQGCSPEPNWDVEPIGWASSDRVMFYRHICGRGFSYYSVDINGNGLREIDSDARSAYLSPDQTRIVYVGREGLSVMNADGSGARSLTTGAAPFGREQIDRSPWSPDGTRIVYRKSDAYYHVINADGTGDRLLADPQLYGNVIFNGWSPDGEQLLFSVYAEDATGAVNRVNVYVANVDGSGVENLTDQAASFNQGAVWVTR